MIHCSSANCWGASDCNDPLVIGITYLLAPGGLSRLSGSLLSCHPAEAWANPGLGQRSDVWAVTLMTSPLPGWGPGGALATHLDPLQSPGVCTAVMVGPGGRALLALAGAAVSLPCVLVTDTDGCVPPCTLLLFDLVYTRRSEDSFCGMGPGQNPGCWAWGPVPSATEHLIFFQPVSGLLPFTHSSHFIFLFFCLHSVLEFPL